MNTVLRLMPDQPGHFALYGEFEDRCAHFLPTYGVTADASLFRQELRQRWVNTPWLSGYFVVCEDGHVVSHCAAWHTVCYGEAVIHISQVEDTAGTLPSSITSFAGLICTWTNDLTEMYAKGGQPQVVVKTAEFITRHEPSKWQALFRKHFVCTCVRSVMRVELNG